jgi:hypothetical protein
MLKKLKLNEKGKINYSGLDLDISPNDLFEIKTRQFLTVETILKLEFSKTLYRLRKEKLKILSN